MVTIRLSRGGTNKRPFYTIVVADSRKARDGRIIERLGYFNPIAVGGETRLQIALDRVNYWLDVGAQPSDRVKHIIAEHQKTDKNTGDQAAA